LRFLFDIKMEAKNKTEKNDFEARQNIAGFFGLLLEIDKRLNPQFYQAPDQKINNKRYDYHRDTNNSNKTK